ncbi:MAG: ABC transporter substrate-binding protein [Tissierellia bacterium]|nr:ABC transporter substrate-binding protein [Tissierellia bacterium]
MNRKLIAILIAALMVLSIFAGCKKDDEPKKDDVAVDDQKDDQKTEPKEDEDKDDDAEEQKEIVWRETGGKTATLNQHIYQTSAESDVFSFILPGLTAVIYDEETQNFKFVPEMAEEMPTHSEDGLVWTFKLRKDLQWADGTPINAHTYIYSWKMQLDPKLKNHRGRDSWFGSDLEVVNAKRYWMGYSEDNIKIQKQQEEEAALEALKAEIDAMEDGEEKEKKQAEYDERNGKLQANWVNVDEADLAEGGCEWEEVGLKALDDYTLEVTLAFAMPEVDFWLSFNGGPKSPVREELYEKGMNEDRTETTYGTSLEMIDYCGTYIMTQWVRDQYKEFVKNPNAPLADVYTPDKIEMRVVEDANTNLQLFEAGEIDVTGVSGDNYSKYEEDPRIVFSRSTGAWSMFMNMTSDKPGKEFLKDVNFRKAMYYGMNREAVAKDIFRTAIPCPYVVSTAKIADPKAGLTFRETPQGKANEPENFGYDTEIAKEYFDKAYEAYGKQMVAELLYFDNSDNMKRVAEFLEQEFENLFGADRLDIQLRAVPWNQSYDLLQAGDYDMGFGAWVGGLFNPWSSMEVYTQGFGIKIDQFFSDEFDELFERTVKGDLIFKPEERLDALQKMEGMLLDNVPFVPIWEARGAILYADRIHLLTREWVPGVGFAPLQAEMDPLP